MKLGELALAIAVFAPRRAVVLPLAQVIASLERPIAGVSPAGAVI